MINRKFKLLAQMAHYIKLKNTYCHRDFAL